MGLVGTRDIRTQSARAQPLPFSSYREKGERWPSSGTRADVGNSPLETHGPCSGPPVAKSLVYGPGPGSSWGDRASSPPRFNIYSRGSTHLGAAQPAPGFFLTFDSLTVGIPVSNLKHGHWDLGPRLVGTQDSRLGTRDSGLDKWRSKSVWLRSWIVFGPSSSGRHFFKPWQFWNLLGISIWDLSFKTSTDGQTGSGFQDLDKRTYRIWVSRPRQTSGRTNELIY
jgi:hypothetical protein